MLVSFSSPTCNRGVSMGICHTRDFAYQAPSLFSRVTLKWLEVAWRARLHLAGLYGGTVEIKLCTYIVQVQCSRPLSNSITDIYI